VRAAIDGVPLTVHHVLAEVTPGRAIRLHFATDAEVDCKTAVSSPRRFASSRLPIRLAVATVAQLDEAPTMCVVELSVAGGLVRGDTHHCDVQLIGNASTGARLGIKLRLDERRGRDPWSHAVSLAVDTEAEGCGKEPGQARDRPQPGVDLNVGSLAVPVRGALLWRNERGLPRLTLSNAPADCNGIDPDGDVTLEAGLDASSRIVEATISGLIVPNSTLSATLDPPRDVALTLHGPLDGVGPIEVSMHGELEVRGVLVRVAGVVTALRCPRKTGEARAHGMR
jgi:hypothetical protein